MVASGHAKWTTTESIFIIELRYKLCIEYFWFRIELFSICEPLNCLSWGLELCHNRQSCFLWSRHLFRVLAYGCYSASDPTSIHVLKRAAGDGQKWLDRCTHLGYPGRAEPWPGSGHCSCLGEGYCIKVLFFFLFLIVKSYKKGLRVIN